MNYEDQLKEEIKTWAIPDEVKRAEKIRREVIRHYKLARDLLLDKLDTQNMSILEVGGGPQPLSNILPYKFRTVIDPLAKEYEKYWAVPDHIEGQIEDFNTGLFSYDLVICTNALDHVENPRVAMDKIDKAIKPGGYFAVMCAENNAITNPHPCHEINLTAKDIHDFYDEDYETVWELTYDTDKFRYGWVSYEGKRGQPAFALLLRKCVGYAI